MNLPSQHHSFDISLAVQYGIERAILIHHFQHWIRINRKRDKNIREGKCWSYQTKEDIAAVFPYMTHESVKYHLDILVNGHEKMGIEPVLLSNNFNRNPMDTTRWYAFIDEEKFGVSEGQIKKMFTKGENPQWTGENPQWTGENPQCNKEQILKPDAKEHMKNPPKARSAKKESAPPSAEASGLAKYFFERIREMKPDFKPPNLTKWAQGFDEILRIDKRPHEKVRELIDWLSSSKAKFTYIQSPATLRKRFDEQEMRMDDDKKSKIIDHNRQYAIHMTKLFPKQYYDLTFNKEMVINSKTGHGLLFDSPYEDFKKSLDKLFGGNSG